MNKLTIIGNCTKDPELRTTTSGRNVCSFNVAVNRRKKVDGQPDADFFSVSAWDQMGENCAKYLNKGKKVCVVGAVSVRTYTNQRGETKAYMEVIAQEVEFISPRQEQTDEIAPKVEERRDEQSGFTEVDTDDLPF